MAYGEGDQELMDKFCAKQGWPQVPFKCYVKINAVVDGTATVARVRGVAEAVYRDYPRGADLLETFAKVRLDAAVAGLRSGQMIEVIRAMHPDVEPIDTLDLLVEGISI